MPTQGAVRDGKVLVTSLYSNGRSWTSQLCLALGKGDAEMVQVPGEPVAPGLSRRTFLATTGGTLAGAVACGLVSQAMAGTNQPQRGGTLRFATRSDAAGL